MGEEEKKRDSRDVKIQNLKEGSKQRKRLYRNDEITRWGSENDKTWVREDWRRRGGVMER